MMNFIVKKFGALSASVIFFALAFSAQAATLSGVLQNSDGDSISGVFISALDGNSGVFGEGVTDSQGVFALSLSSVGTFDVGVHLGEISSQYPDIGIIEGVDLGSEGSLTLVESSNFAVVSSGQLVISLPSKSSQMSFNGVLVDTDNNPVTDADVYVFSDNASGHRDSEENGAFVIPLASAGNFELEVYPTESSGLVRLHLTGLTIAESGELTSTPSGTSVANNVLQITLSSGNTLSGKVTDSSGNAVENVEVNAYNVQEGNFGFSKTDVNGDYSMKLLPGSYEVSAFPPEDGDMVSPKPRNTDLSTADVSDFDFSIDSGLIFSGVVTVEESGNPLPNVNINVFSPDNGDFYSVLSNTDGEYRIVLNNAFYYVNAVPPVESDYIPSEFQEIEIEGENKSLNFALGKGITISGKITAADDNPGNSTSTEEKSGGIGDVGIGVFNPYGFGAGGFAFTNAKGEYKVAIQGSESGTKYVVNVFPPPGSTYMPPDQKEVKIYTDASKNSEVNFELDGGYILSGTITGSDGGDPVPNVGVDAFPDNFRLEEGSFDFGNFAFTESDGSYSMGLRKGRTYNIYIFLPPGGSKYVSPSTSTQLTMDEEQKSKNFQLDTGAILQGTVYAPTSSEGIGAGVDGIFVNAMIANNLNWDPMGFGFSETDADGKYLMALKEGETYEVSLFMPWGKSDYITPIPQTSTALSKTAGTVVDFTLLTGIRVYGTVYNSDQSTGIPNVFINVFPTTWSDDGDWGGFGTSDRDGGYSIALKGGKIYNMNVMIPKDVFFGDDNKGESGLIFSSDKYAAPPEAISIDMTGNEEVKHDVFMVGAQSITIKVKTATGDAVSGAWVDATTTDPNDPFAWGNYVGGGETSESGSFTMNLADGNYSIRVYPPMNGNTSGFTGNLEKSVTVAGEDAEVVIGLPETIGVSVTVLDSKGSASENAWVEIQSFVKFGDSGNGPGDTGDGTTTKSTDTTDTNGYWSYAGGSTTGPEGVALVEVEAPEDGEEAKSHRFVAYPPYDQANPNSSFGLSVASDPITINAQTEITLQFPVTNSVEVIVKNSDGSSVGSGYWVDAQKYDPNNPELWGEYAGGGVTNQDGIANLSLASGNFKLVAWPPHDPTSTGNYTPPAEGILLNLDGDKIGEEGRVTLQFPQTVNLTVTVTENGSLVDKAFVSVFEYDPNNEFSFGMWVGGGETDSTGKVVLSVPAGAGKYYEVNANKWDSSTGNNSFGDTKIQSAVTEDTGVSLTLEGFDMPGDGDDPTKDPGDPNQDPGDPNQNPGDPGSGFPTA